VLSPGAWLATLLAIASVAVLAGGRMTERTRRVGLLKAVGGSPGLVTATLMAENLVLALAAAAVGLVAGWLAAPLLTNPGAALIGTPGALGAAPRDVAAGLTAAQLLPALPGAVFGIPLGIGLFAAADHGGMLTVPPAWWLAVAVLATLAVVTGLAAVPARIGARQPAAEILQAETA
jgi:ABC-type antimicrobial peptide transport system permease subunit